MKKALIIIAIVLAVLLLAAAVGGYGLVKTYLGKVERIETEKIEVIAPEQEDFEISEPITDETPLIDEEALPPEVVSEWDDIEALDDDELINILLVGQDYHGGEERGRSDSMILCSMNPETKEVSLISFMRDTYVKLPDGYSYNRLNAPYRFGGFPMLCETLSINFGVSVDGCVEVDFDSFKEVIDAVDGVDIELTPAEADYMQLSPGINHLDSEKALEYARIRSIDGDFNRTQRQRNVLMSVFEEIRTADLKTILSLADELLGLVRTDMTDDQIWKLIMKVAPMLTDLQISTHRVPADDAYYMTMRNEMSVLIPDLDKIREDLETEYLPFGK